MTWTIGLLMAVAAYAGVSPTVMLDVEEIMEGLRIPASLNSGLRESVIDCIESQASTSAGSSADWKTVIVSCLTRSIDAVGLPHLIPRLAPALRGKRSWHCDPNQPVISDASTIASNADVADDKEMEYASEDERLASLAPGMGQRRPEEDHSDVTMNGIRWRHRSPQAEESDDSDASAARSNAAATDDEDDATAAMASYASCGSDIVYDTLEFAPAGGEVWHVRSGPRPRRRREPRAQTSMNQGCTDFDGELLAQMLQQVSAIEAEELISGQTVSVEPTWPATTVQDDVDDDGTAFQPYPEDLQAQPEAENDATANDAGLARLLQQEYHNEAARVDELYALQLQQEEWGTGSVAPP